MLLNIIKQFNWIDIFVAIILLRIGYNALKRGISIEFFKLLGTIAAIYLSLHYYTIFSDAIRGRITTEENALGFLSPITFITLAILGYFLFAILRSIFYRFIKMEAAPRLNKWGGLLLGLVRGILFLSLIIFMMVITRIDYLQRITHQSYFGKGLFKVAPATYAFLWNKATSKFMVNEEFNQSVLTVQEGYLEP